MTDGQEEEELPIERMNFLCSTRIGSCGGGGWGGVYNIVVNRITSKCIDTIFSVKELSVCNEMNKDKIG